MRSRREEGCEAIHAIANSVSASSKKAAACVG